MSKNICSGIQKSVEWCQGRAELPGVRRRIYYISNADIVKYPALVYDDLMRPQSAVLSGEFVLAADATFKYIDILPEKSQLTSDSQGEVPSQTQINKLVALCPSIGPEASALAAYVNNTSCTFIVPDMLGRARVLGNEMYDTKCSVSQDLGQGATGSTSTTLTAECTDVVPCPFYYGKIETEDGPVDFSQDKPKEDIDNAETVV